jgi:aromatic ring-opening dioxygenase catalytic subunit (LigB family)
MFMGKRCRVLFLSHGGGPLPLLGDEGHKEMVARLNQIASEINQPSAIIVISAHWEENAVTITAGAFPSLIYDYYGFPEESYRIEYPCPGEPGLANHIHELLGKAGIKAILDEQRGFDHGLFVPLKIMYPDADIPCVQVSLIRTLDPVEHVKIGQALQGLGGDNVLIIGSGFSFHNMREFFVPETLESKSKNESFENWLIETFTHSDIDEDQRVQRLIKWEDAPSARFCHPREEHLLPLHVCYGIAQKTCAEYFELQILNKKSSMYLW